MYVPRVRLALHGRYRFLNGKLKTTCLELPAERLGLRLVAGAVEQEDEVGTSAG